MTYDIEPIFLIFPVCCLAIGLFKQHTGKIMSFLLGLSFIIIYSCSLNGSDYEGYNSLYNSILYGSSIFDIHGEVGFALLMSIAAECGVEYSLFRIILLSSLTIVLFVMVFKISPNFSLSVFFITTMFVIYTISAYRQFIVISISIFLIYKFYLGKRKEAIIGTTVLLLFHITAIVPLLFMIAYCLFKDNKIQRFVCYITNNIFFIVIISMILRLFVYYILKTGIFTSVLYKFIGNHASLTPTLISFGLISRTVFLLLVSFMYYMVKPRNQLTNMLFWYYSVGMIVFIIVPLDFFMGRLMNNANIISSLVIPRLLYYRYTENLVEHNRKSVSNVVNNNLRIVVIVLIVISLIILINQLKVQNGYTPYVNYFF